MRRLLLIIMLLLGSGAAALADPSAGKALAKQKCQLCHGIDGIAKIPNAPHLAGESPIYLQTQLKAFRSGKRTNEMMSIIAKDLSEQNIADLADWYSSITITATMPGE